MSSKNMPDPTVFITGHNATGDSILYPKRALKWDVVDNGGVPMAVAYINKMPADLNNDADLHEYDHRMVNGPISLVSSGASVLRYVDLAPGYTCMMHRTQSIDYGVVLEGAAECVFPTGEIQLMKRGDVMIQRYTKHAWRNTSQTSWARIIFVLQDCKPLTVAGETLKEDLGRGESFIPRSDNE